MSKTRVFIYGSCVSRDTFEHLDPEQFELVEYVARQSALSATTRPVEMLAPPTLESRFQQRMVSGDFTSSLRPLLAQHASEIDVLLIDLTDERLGAYLLPDGTVVTRSVELIESGAERSLPQGSHYLAFGTQQHYEYWSGAVRALGDAIRNTVPQAAVALLDIPWAEWSESGQQTPDSFGVSAAQANPVFRSYVEVAVQELGAHVVALDPSEVMSGQHHPWGDAPFHYAENVYLEAVRRLTGAEGRVVWGPGTQALSGSQVSVPSAPTRASVQERRAPSGTVQQAPAPTPPLRRLEGGPNFLIAGTQRGGTMWLQQQLSLHPDVYIAEGKGTQYFNRPGRINNEDESAAYLAAFVPGRNQRWRGERSPAYFWTTSGPFSPKKSHDTAAAIRDRADDNAPILLTLRDPVSRAISGYWHNFSLGNVDLPTSIFQVPTDQGIIDLGFYRRHYEHWAQVLGTERIRVVLYDDLVKDPAAYLAQTLHALGIPETPEFWSAVKLKARPASKQWLTTFKKRKHFSAQEVAALHDLYRDDISFVEDILGRSLPTWHDRKALIKKHTSA